MTDVISIQSQVVHGHVGNSAAVFPMQAAGLEVAAVPTALLSNHPHYPTMRGRILQSELLADLLRGVEERGLVDQAKAVVTGYLGSVENAHVVADFLRRARTRNPSLLYVCDPVIGDDDLGIFVDEGLIAIFRDALVPMASIITPNRFELGRLSNREVRSVLEVDTAARALCERGTRAVVTTGCVLDDTPPGSVETRVGSSIQSSGTAITQLPIRPCGTGDLFTALLIVRLLAGMTVHEAAAGATKEIFAVLERTRAAGATEMRIIGYPFATVSDLRIAGTFTNGEQV